MAKRKLKLPVDFTCGTESVPVLSPTGHIAHFNISGDVKRNVIVKRGKQEIVIAPLDDGIEVTMLHDARLTAVIEPQIGNRWRLRFMPDLKPRRAKK